MIYAVLFGVFFKIGLFTFGGGHAMIPMINKEVTERGWLSIEQLIDFIAVSESTPGPFAINVATFVGNTAGGLLGAAAATIGVVLPSFIIIVLIAKSFARFKDSEYVKYALSGLRPVVIGLIASAAVTIGVTTFIPHGISYGVDLRMVAILVFIVVLNAFKKLHPIKIVALGAVCGLLAYGLL